MDSPTTKTKLESPPTYLTLHRSLPEPPHPAVVVGGYRECRKNHAVRLGRLALDGCREFIPSSSVSPMATGHTKLFVPESSLLCGACGCHRNFHRRDYWASPGPVKSPLSPRALSPVPTSYYVPAPWMLRAPITGLLGQDMSLSDGNTDEECHQDHLSSGMKERRKRERTKFSMEQKEKMEAFAEKIGWQIKSSGDDEKRKAVDEFCREVGVSRGVLKVWMNNHKYKHKQAISC